MHPTGSSNANQNSNIPQISTIHLNETVPSLNHYQSNPKSDWLWPNVKCMCLKEVNTFKQNKIPTIGATGFHSTKMNWFKFYIPIGRPPCLYVCMFYSTTICGVWRYCLNCWGGNVCKIERNRIDRLIRNAERVIGVEPEPVDSVYRGLFDRKLRSVWDDSGHPMHTLLSGRVSLRHSGRLRLPSLATNWYREFFTVRAIKLFNEKLQTDCILPSKLSWAIEMLT